MIRSITILLSILLFATPCYSADTNWAADAGSTNTGSTDGSVETFGTPALMFDENDATYYGSSEFEAGAVTTVGNSLFACTHAINRIRVIFGTYYPSSAGNTYKVEAYYSAGWNTVDSGNVSATTQTLDLTGLTLTGVSQVKVTIVDNGFETGFGWSSICLIYEISAWGTDPAGYVIIY